ncbi:MAG: hypothetical protein HKP58_03160 [Desulfatitalea sp.]|nr:hypothetical protein [Desulfatitalea sp.]NNJ99391.1 hypothetical protein [Desulfatitalea sp.]
MRIYSKTALNTAYENTLYRTNVFIKTIEEKRPDEKTGDAYQNLAFSYRHLGICELMGKGDSNRFFGFMQKAAFVSRYFYSMVQKGFDPSPVNLTNKSNGAYFDAALISQGADTAAFLARNASQQHNPEYEYEDDFLLCDFMQKSFLNYFFSESHDLNSILNRWEIVLAGNPNYYYDTCKSIHEKDINGFEMSLNDLIENRKSTIGKWKDHISMDPDIRLIESSIYTKGLALLLIAEKNGFQTQEDYALIPRLARTKNSLTMLSLDSWRDIEEGMSQAQ